MVKLPALPQRRFHAGEARNGVLDGRELPKNMDIKGGLDSTWYGYSVGHWDADYKLVIDTFGSGDSSWLDPRGYSHSVSGRYVAAFESLNRQ